MLHYSCDLCKRPIDTATDVRHVVKIEVFQAVEEGGGSGCCGAEAEDMGDHLDDMQHMLETIDERDLHAEGDFNGGAQSLRFDLCDACRTRFLKNPLGIKTGKKLDFSQN